MTQHNPRSANDLDAQIGKNITLLRKLKKLTQKDLSEALGVSFQQVQKYEKGTNRISASRLYEVARVLNVPVQKMFKPIRLVGGGA